MADAETATSGATVTIVTETSAPRGDAMSQLLAPYQSIEAVDGVSDPDGNGWLLQEVKTRAPGG